MFAMNPRRSIATIAIVLAIALTIVACGGGDSGGSTSTTQPTNTTSPTSGAASERFSGVVVTSDISTGSNRFAVGVIDQSQGQPIVDANVSLKFIKLTSASQGEVRFESPATAVTLDRFVINDSTGAKTTTGATGVYVAQADFTETGDWAVQITGSTKDGTDVGQINLPFQVVPHGQVLGLGDPAPKSRQTLASDVSDISQIDSMQPRDQMHDMTIADAVTSGKPTVILFGTPAFCETQVCGPVMQGIMLPLYDQFHDRANFIHVEPYFLDEVRSGKGLCAVPAFNIDLARAGTGKGPGPCPMLSDAQLRAAGESWNLTTEPIVFVVDSNGTIAGRFEGVSNEEEVKSVLDPLLVPATAQ